MCYSKAPFHEMHIKIFPVFTGKIPKTKQILRRIANGDGNTIE